jgi:lipopolysaccharide/colanic/teichoic acid biosynthesis glycosyltransferase
VAAHEAMIIRVGREELAATRPVQTGKRAFDTVVTVFLLVLFSPVIAVTALAILVADGRPVLYRQLRVGLDGGQFTMLKFRSMRVGSHAQQRDLAHAATSNGLLFKVDNDPRVTTVGRFIRRTSIDELPQLWNVMRGDMSLVGPRPLPVDPSAFGPIDGSRHVVRPGITGLWQIKGRDRQDYDQMVELDLRYLATWSLADDAAILVRTVPALFRRAGPV